MTPVRLEPAAPWSRVKHFTTEPLGSLVRDETFKLVAHSQFDLSCWWVVKHKHTYTIIIMILRQSKGSINLSRYFELLL